MMEEHYVAILDGREYRATLTVDPDVVNLRWNGSPPPIDGFEEIKKGFYRRASSLGELDVLYQIEWFCEFHGEPFKVISEQGDDLLLDYLGLDIDKARSLDLRIEEPLVATGIVARDAVENLREVKTKLWPR